MKKSFLTIYAILFICLFSGCGNKKDVLPELDGISLSETYINYVKALQDKGFRTINASSDKTTLEGKFKNYGDCLYIINNRADGAVGKITMALGHPLKNFDVAQAGYKILETEMVQMIGVPAVELGAMQDHIIQSAIVKSDKLEANIAIEKYNIPDTYVLMCYIYCD